MQLPVLAACYTLSDLAEDHCSGRPCGGRHFTRDTDPRDNLNRPHYSVYHGVRRKAGMAAGDVCGCNDVALRWTLRRALLADRGNEATANALGSSSPAVAGAPPPHSTIIAVGATPVLVRTRVRTAAPVSPVDSATDSAAAPIESQPKDAASTRPTAAAAAAAAAARTTVESTEPASAIDAPPPPPLSSETQTPQQQARHDYHRNRILHSSFKNTFVTTPWFVAVDDRRGALVVTVRGTLSIDDAITDALALPKSIARDIESAAEMLQRAGVVINPEQAWCHDGMWRAAQNIRDQLFAYNLLEAAAPVEGAATATAAAAMAEEHDDVVRRPTTGAAGAEELHSPALAEAPPTNLAPQSGYSDSPTQSTYSSTTRPPSNDSDSKSLPTEAHRRLRRDGSDGCRSGSKDEGPQLRCPMLDSTAADGAPPQRRGLQLIITGHSLGAGVAALLSLLLRPHFPGIRCYAFSPPGALVSPSLAKTMEEWVTSVVVSRISVKASRQ